METGLKAKTVARPNPSLLVWAREEAGMSVRAVATRAGISEPRLIDWEAGTSQPSFPQLRQLAQIYHRALAVFFLSERPTNFRIGVDFRRMPGEVADLYSPALRLDIREVELRRDSAMDMFTSLNFEPPTFSFTVDQAEDPESVGDRLRAYLKPDVSANMDQRAAFNAWRDSLHKGGALVFQIARTPLSELRAFSLAAGQLPVVAINRRDALAGRIFSMLHEVVHIGLNLTGVCDLREDATQAPEIRIVERFCNHVAGAALVPIRDLLRHRRVQSHGPSRIWDDEEIVALARAFGASKEVVLRRLLLHELTTPDFYETTRERYLEEYADLERIRQTESSEIKRNVPVETIGLLGAPYVDLVLTNFATDRITLSEVSTLLNVRTKHVQKIAALMARR